jgi:ribonuclease VapC
MIVDTSALIAILRMEKEARPFAQAIEKAPSRKISAVTFVETAAVIDSAKDAIASRKFDELIAVAEFSIEPVTEAHARLAREAYRDFGKGSGHQAQLNFGDCFAYALAKATGEPLLYKGNDFKHTDLKSAL